ncbi:MAG: hypothetical protein Roseis2KO_08260 [Roseivirga sp.]
MFYENGTGTVLDINANDGDGGADDVNIGYSLSGDDAALFDIDDQGILTYKLSPDYDSPSDADKDNFYSLTVTADDGEQTDNITTQEVTVIVTPEVEEGFNLSNEIVLGSAIFGEADGDEFGESVAINSDGTIVAVGSIKNAGSGADAGHVRVFSFQNGGWVQMGSDIDAEAAGDKFGSAVSLNYDGTMLAVGATDNNDAATVAGHTRVFRWTGSDWSQLGADIDGKLSGDWSGKYLSFSADGNTLAIGSQYPDDGATQVRVYTWNNVEWIQLGDDIGLEAEVLQITPDGRTLVVGSSGWNGVGVVRVYDWTGTAWEQRGANIDGEETGDLFGSAVGISADGNFLAIGAPGTDYSNNNTGSLTFYHWNTDRWSQTRSTIQSSSENSRWGANLSLSADGSSVLWGTPSLSGSSGGARYAWWNGSEWQQQSIFSSESSSGQVVGLSADGRVAAVSAPLADDITVGDKRGSVSAFLLLNRNPVIRSTDQVSFPENSSDPVLDVDVVDGDGGAEDENLTYSLVSGGDNELFSITETGIITFNAPPDFEKPKDFNFDNVYELQLKIEDHPVELMQELKVTVVDVSVDPPLFSSPGAIAFLENSTEAVVDVNANDGDGGADDETVSYSLSGEDAGNFNINEEGILTFLVAPDFDDPTDTNKDNFYHLTVTADDGGNSDNLTSQEMTVLVVPVLEEGYNFRTQLGSAIFGEADGDRSGGAVAINATGTIMAIGSTNNTGAGPEAGHVRVFGLVNDQWTQLGLDIDAEAAGDKSGTSVSLSYNGTTLAVGAPGNDGNGTDAGHVKVYEWKGEQWDQLGADIEGSGTGDTFGSMVSLSADGSMMAVGAATADDGNRQVRVYRWNGTTWSQVGEDIIGNISSMQLNALGTTLVVGMPNSGSGGRVQVYEWAGHAWLQRSATLEAEEDNDGFGASVGISADGNTLAIGMSGYDSYIYDNVGGVKFYGWDEDRWIQKYAIFQGSTENGRMGSDLGLSADGTAIISGNPAFGNFKGEVRYATWNEGQWQGGSQQGPSNGGGRFGDFVSLSADGRVMMVGAPLAHDITEGDERGRVSTFSLVNRTPVIQSVSEVTYEENRTDAVLDVNVSDGEGNPVDENITYSLGEGGDNIHFTITETGVITFNIPPDFERPLDFNFDNVYILNVNISDYPIELTQQVTVTVTDASVDPPVFKSPAVVTYIEKGADAVLDVDAYDGEEGDTDESVAYSLKGTDAGAFFIDENGRLFFRVRPDYDLPLDSDEDNIYELTAVASSNGSTDQDLKVIVIPLVEGEYRNPPIQMGEQFDGENERDFLGGGVALNPDGTVMAIGSPGHSGSATRSGKIEVYSWNGSEWRQKGQVLQGDEIDDRFGSSASLSYDGNILAVSAVYVSGNGSDGYARIYKWEDDNWIQMGSDIIGEEQGDLFGADMSLNAEGDVLTVSAPGFDDNRGRVYVYQWDGTDWRSKGEAFTGNPDSRIGSYVNLNAIGNIISFSAVGNETINKATVFEWNEIHERWDRLGDNLVSDPEIATLIITSISADGHTFLAATATGNKVFDWDGTDWVQRGDQITDDIGILSGDGSTALFYDSFGFKVYKWNGAEWRWLFSDSFETQSRSNGSDIDFSLDGGILAYGNISISNNGTSSGQVIVLRTLDRVPIFISEQIASFPENTTGKVLEVKAIAGDDEAVNEGLTFSIQETQDSEFFAINELGDVSMIKPVNYEEPEDVNEDNVYIVIVTVSDGVNNVQQAIAVSITDLDADPPLFTSGKVTSAFEGSTSSVFDVNANNGIGGAADIEITYSLSGDDAGLFSIGADGALSFLNEPDFDSPADMDTDNIYDLIVTAQNQAVNDNSTSQPLRILLLPKVKHAPQPGTQIGETIFGEAADDLFGTEVALSADGRIMAVSAYYHDAQGLAQSGHVKVYNWNGTEWAQMGETLVGLSAFDFFGSALSLSYEGTTLAVSASSGDQNLSGAGDIMVYDWDGQTWAQRGGPISGDVRFEGSANNIHLNADGTILVSSDPSKEFTVNNENIRFVGQVRAYQWSGTEWLQMGEDLNGTEKFDRYGTSVNLDAVGHRMVIGTGADRIDILNWDGEDWVVDSSIYAETQDFTGFGAFVSLSADGKTLVTSSPSVDPSGSVQVFTDNGSSWVKRGSLITKDFTEEVIMGASLHISADGNSFAVSSRGSENLNGQVHIYNWENSDWTETAVIRPPETNNRGAGAIALSANGRVVVSGTRYGENDIGRVRVFSLDATEPTGIALSQSEVNENKASGTEVGAFSGLNGSLGGPYTYTLVSGDGDTDNGVFEISGNSLLTKEVFDFEVRTSYSIRVQLESGDGLILQDVFAISVANVNEVPSAFDLTSLTMAENEPAGTQLGEFTIIDPDNEEVHTVSFSGGVGGEDNDSFEILGNGLTIKTAPDFESKSSYNVRLRATDLGGLFIERAVVVTITDLNEAPTVLNIDTQTIPENNVAGALVVNLTTTDQDAGDQHTYSLVAGEGADDNDAFEVNGSGLLAKNVLDFETKDAYRIRLKTEDQGGLSLEQEFILFVLNLPDPILRLSESPDVPETGKGETSEFEITVFNDGAADLLVDQIIYPGAFSGPAGDITVAPSSSQVITVTFSPLEAVVYQGSIEFRTNAGTQSVEVSGEGAIISGIDDGSFLANSIVVYPNPADKLLTIDLSGLSSGLPLDIKAVNPLGVAQFELISYREKLLKVDVSDYKSGLYFFHITNGKSSAIKKVMIKR